jgi:hypothetical protein
MTHGVGDTKREAVKDLLPKLTDGTYTVGNFYAVDEEAHMKGEEELEYDVEVTLNSKKHLLRVDTNRKGGEWVVEVVNSPF